MIGARARSLSQRQRRVRVLVEYAGIFALPMVSILSESAWWMLLALVGVVTTVLIHGRLLVLFTQEIANKLDADLDERQTAVRDSAHRAAYQILGSLVLGALFLLWVIIEPLGGRPWTPQISIQDPTTIFVTTLWVYITLPTAVIAWREPAPAPGD
jgi:hypothetical protein